MKKILIACLLWVSFGNGVLHAQAILSAKIIKISPDPFTIGQKITINLVITNSGDSTFTDPSINIYYKTSAHPVFDTLTTLNEMSGVRIAAHGGTFAVNGIHLFTDSIYFPPADTIKNIIVVWPTGLENTGQPDPNVKYAIDSTPVIYKEKKSTPTSLFLPENDFSEKAIKLYPNPTTHELNIECLYSNVAVKTIQITNITGQLIGGWYFTGNKVIIENIPSGVYLVSVFLSDGNIARYKVIKE